MKEQILNYWNKEDFQKHTWMISNLLQGKLVYSLSF